MNKFFVRENEICGDEIHITGPDVNHIKNVLRMRPGEEVLVGVRGSKAADSEKKEESGCRLKAADSGERAVRDCGSKTADSEERAKRDCKSKADDSEERTGSGSGSDTGSSDPRETDGVKAGLSGEAEYLCRIREITADEVKLEILDYLRTARELPSRITLFQGLPKSDKMELIVQKAVELGTYAVAPVAMKRSVVKIEEKKKEAKRKRWQAIAESAAAQSKRSVIPEVLPVMSFAEALRSAAEMDVILLPYEDAKNMEATRRELSAIRPGQSVGVFIGPEGGFAEEEVEAAKQAGAKVITLGNRILRTETAGLMVLSVLGYLLEV